MFPIELKFNNNYIWLYFLLFFIIWCFRELWLVQYIELMNPVVGAITSAIIKIMIWIVPVVVIVLLVEKREPFSYLGLRHNVRQGLKWTGWLAVAFVVYFVVFNLVILRSSPDFNIGFHEWLNVILLVGITEEVVSRGFLLRKLMESYRFWIANALTALLFVSIHFPIWFYKGIIQFPSILGSVGTMFILGVLFGYIYKKTNSLWSVIIIHSFYNLLVTIFY